VRLIQTYPDADMIYSDEDKIDVANRRYEPFFKPDWSPDLFLSCNYLNHLTVLRTTMLNLSGGFRLGYEGSQDYDLFLRVIAHTQHIYHIPKVLYHWRAAPTSTASDLNAKPQAHVAARRALQAHLSQTHISGEVEEGITTGRWRLRYLIRDNPVVSIIIPTAQVQRIKDCLTALQINTNYSNYEIIVVDNSQTSDVASLVSTFDSQKQGIKLLDCRGQPFNFSKINNLAVQSSQGPLVLFLNDDVQPITPEWLIAMVEHAQRAEIGAVGAQLLYSDGTFQHAGVVLGISEGAGHALKYLPAQPQVHTYFDFGNVIRNCSAVTCACLMTRRAVFLEVGGFDEDHFPVAFQDVDLCLKIGQKGYRIIYTPYARLYHYESQTKSAANKIPSSSEVHYLQNKWKDVIATDPFYNPNLSRTREDFSLMEN
jgi:GT2 family glycosyltransferase